MQPPLVPVRPPGSGFHRQALALLGALAVCASCATPRRAPLCDADVAASVAGRAATVADLETALALADLTTLAVPRPTAATMDPASQDFWWTCAYLYEPGVRQARRRLEARRALAKGAGTVQSIDVTVEHVANSSDRETEAMGTIDLLALFGLGPAAAAKELARAEVCEALADLEAAVWAARFRVMRARIRLAAALERERAATALAKDASEDDARIKTLDEGGRGVPAELAWARTGIERIREAGARARLDAARALEDLAVASGLPPDHPALQGELALGLEDVHRSSGTWLPASSTDAHHLLVTSPGLRLLRFRYAVAEARVRGAAAATWPMIGIGPKGVFLPDDFLGGGILDLSIPLPAATRAALCAAIVERTAAREALEDELVRVLARNHSLNRQMITLQEDVRPRSFDRRDAADRMWRAAREQFRANEAALNGWILALEMRLEAAMSAIETGEMRQMLAADIAEAVEAVETPIPAESRPQ
jgi:outer membrane protein TolC